MKGKFLLMSIALLPCALQAQKYEIKKGKVALDKNIVATYDGKGGLLKAFDLTISTPAAKPLIHIVERAFDFKNPLRPDGVRWVDITFLGATEKTMKYRYPSDAARLYEKQLIGLFFNDSTKALVQAEALDEANVSAFIERHNYDYNTDSLSVRKFEEENRQRILEPLSRDPKKPVIVSMVSSNDVAGMESNTVYEVRQDDILIGKVEKKVKTIMSATAYYTIWKRVTVPYIYAGREQQFGVLAYMEASSSTFDNDLVLMTDKSKVKVKSTDHTKAERQLVNLLISSGLL